MRRTDDPTLPALLLALLRLPITGQAQDDEILRPQEAYRYAVADTGQSIEIDWLVEELGPEPDWDVGLPVEGRAPGPAGRRRGRLRGK